MPKDCSTPPRHYYNDFIIVGPDDGPIEHNNDIRATFEQIYNEGLNFVSLNPYGIIVVSSSFQLDAAQAFADWILSSSMQELVARFGVAEFGEPLFFPDIQ